LCAVFERLRVPRRHAGRSSDVRGRNVSAASRTDQEVAMFWFIPLEVEDPILSESKKVPLVNALLIIANVVVFWWGWRPVCAYGNGLFSTLTYAFGHVDAMHLIGNMWFLAVFGTPVNRRVGNVLYLLAYLSAALFVGTLAWTWSWLLASGAIFAIETMCAILFAGSRIRVVYFALFPFSIVAGLLRRPPSAVQWFIRWDTFHAPALLWGFGFVLVLQVWHAFFWLSDGVWHWTYLGHLLGIVWGVVIVLVLPRSISMGRELPAVAEV
jgi:membrane associated rhomboid family serine protease